MAVSQWVIVVLCMLVVLGVWGCWVYYHLVQKIYLDVPQGSRLNTVKTRFQTPTLREGRPKQPLCIGLNHDVTVPI